MDFWGKANVFNPNSFAYTKDRSTVTQRLCCFNDGWNLVTKEMINPTDQILLEFSKAFDSVPHRRLLHKLERYRQPSFQMDSEVFNRSVATRVLRGSYWSWSQVKSGVPHGTMLGPILFIMYVNDISTRVSSTGKSVVRWRH